MATSVRFTPNRLERRCADTYWECMAEDVTGVRPREGMAGAIETAAGAETFQVIGGGSSGIEAQGGPAPGYHGLTMSQTRSMGEIEPEVFDLEPAMSGGFSV